MFIIGKAYALKHNVTYTVGRFGANITTAAQDMSRKHAEVECKNGKVWIKDTGSRFGTYVGETAVLSSGNNRYVHWDLII